MRQVVVYKMLKTTENHPDRETQKVVAVAYRRWSFTSGSNCKALAGNILVFWISGRLRQVVTHRGSTVLD